MKKGQTSIEYLLLTAGVVLTAVVAGQYVVTSGAQVHKTTVVEANNLMTIHDTIPPTTTLMCNGTSCFTKYNHDVKISFVCQDNLQGTGCKETHYKINGGAWQTCSQPAGCKDKVTLHKPASGSTTYSIEFYSVDMNGNVENKKMVTITIGGSFSATGACAISYMPQYPKPGDSVQIDAKTSTQLKGVEITVKKGSTVVATKNCGDMGSGQTCSLAFRPSSEGAYDVSVTGKDAFGNSGTCGTTTVNVDGTAPAITFNSPDACAWYKEDFTVDVDASDGPNPGSSLMNQWKYDVYDSSGHYTSGWLSISPTQSTTKSFGVKVGPSAWCSEQGPKKCNVQVSFTDRAGNTGSAKKQYSIDYTAPTISADIPAEGWVNKPINVTLKCTDSPSNGSGCKAIYWKFVDPDTACPTPGSSGWQGKTFSKSGCPYQWPKTATADATLSCSLCAKDICYYAEDGAGNISAVKRSTVTNPNGNSTDGSYAIDTIPPSCGISLESEPQTVEGGCDTDWKMGGIGGYKYSIVCGDQTNGSGLKTVTISLAGVKCGGCTLDCKVEKDIRSTWVTGGGITCSGTTCTASVSPDTVPIGFDCTVDAPSGSTCVASGISVTAEDWAGNTASFSGGTTMKLDAKSPEVTHSLVSTDPATAVCGSWYKSFTITVTGTDEDATSCNSGVCIFQAFVDNGSASPASQKFSPTASKTINNVKITANSGYEGQVCVTSDFHDAVGGANWTDTQICKNLDNKKPSITVTTDKGTYYVGEHINITATASDGGSGLKNITIADYGGKTYSCGTKSATYKGYITATCQEAAAGSTTVVAMASDWIGNTNSDEKSVAVRCSGNDDCSCLDKITCSGDTEIDWEGVCNGGKCSGPKKVGSFDCSAMSCSDVVTECTCNDSGCTEKGYHQDPTCIEGSGCACVQGSSFTRSVTSCPT